MGLLFSSTIASFQMPLQEPLQNPVLIFSLILFIILIAPLALNKLRIPGIIGLILSGIIIGPYGLNILENNSFVDVFSTIGLLYIMFIAGLELDLNEFKANQEKSILFGIFTFVIPLAIGFPLCYYVLSIWDGNFDFGASLLVASMFSTHTLLTYPIVSKLGISKDKAVAVTVGGTILTDTAVLILLAIILGSHDGGLTQEFWIRLSISIVLYSAFMFLVIPRVAGSFFKKLESEKHSHFIFVLSVVFFAAFLAEVAGLEAIIGAFVAGLALNKLIPASSVLMNRIQFFGNSLFIPFFLISVGMIVDVSVILSGWTALIIAAVLTLVALFGKWAAAFLTQITFRYTKNQRNLIFGLSGAHAAATLAVIMVGHREGIVDDAILNATVIIILVSCLVASFITENAAKKIVAEADDEADLSVVSGASNEQILIPIANTHNIEKMLDFAVMVKEKSSENPLSILTVVPNNAEAEQKILKAKQSLENFVKETEASETNVNVLATIDHNPASGISRTVRELFADLVLLGWPQKIGFIEKIIGDKLGGILRNTDKTLFICDFKNPLINHKRLFLVTPPRAELEEGFPLWVSKVAKLAEELSIPIELNSTEETKEAVLRFAKANKLTLSINSNIFDDWEDFFILSRHIKENDFIILVSARKGSLTYFSHLERLPQKLEVHYNEYSKCVIYPGRLGK